MTPPVSTTGPERHIEKMTKEDFKSLPHRDWNGVSVYDTLLLFPTRRKHSSGWACMMLVGVIDRRAVEICTVGSDDICWHIPASRHRFIPNIRTDCILKNGGIHFHGHGKFKVGSELSSIDVEFLPSAA